MSANVRTVMSVVLGLLGLTLGAWLVGLAWAPALLVALSAVAVLGLRRVPVTNQDEDWPEPPGHSADHGVRREVARLSWSLHGHESRVERPSLVRLRGLAEQRLAQRGLRLSEPVDADACRDLLGSEAYRIVTAGRRVEVTFDEFARALSALERLTDGRGRES